MICALLHATPATSNLRRLGGLLAHVEHLGATLHERSASYLSS
jgi:hypothetical protein